MGSHASTIRSATAPWRPSAVRPVSHLDPCPGNCGRTPLRPYKPAESGQRAFQVLIRQGTPAMGIRMGTTRIHIHLRRPNLPYNRRPAVRRYVLSKGSRLPRRPIIRVPALRTLQVLCERHPPQFIVPRSVVDLPIRSSPSSLTLRTHVLRVVWLRT